MTENKEKQFGAEARTRTSRALFHLVVLFSFVLDYKSHKLWSSVQWQDILSAESVWQKPRKCLRINALCGRKTVVFVS